MNWEFLSNNLPHLSALLNLTATGLLAAGLWKIKTGRARVHKKLMLAAFCVSMAFLAVYLFHKVAMHQATGQWNRKFPTDVPAAARYTYFGILLTHIPLAIAVPVLAIRAIMLAKAGKILAHKRLVKFAFPIWMYVSVTGVLMYMMLYHLYA